MRILPVVAAVTAAFLVVACSSPTPPKGVTVVNNFDAKRYLGTWYEIARFDHRFERGLDKVTATYSLLHLRQTFLYPDSPSMATSVQYAIRAGYTLYPTGYRLHKPEQNGDE